MSAILHIAPSRTGHTWIGQMIQSWCPDSEYHNLENFDPAAATYFSKKDCVIVLQIRDLLNWYASCLAMRDTLEKIHVEWMNGYKKIIQEFYVPTYLKDHTVVYVTYDTFFIDQDYRKRVCFELGGIYSEEKLEVIEGYARSSFSKYSHNGEAQEMTVLNRYTQVRDNLQAYRSLFKAHPDLLSVYKKNCKDVEKRHFIKCLKV